MSIGINNLKIGDTLYVSRGGAINVVSINNIYTDENGNQIYTYRNVLKNNQEEIIDKNHIKYKMIDIINK